MAYLQGLGRVPFVRTWLARQRAAPRANVPRIMLLGDGSFSHQIVVSAVQYDIFAPARESMEERPVETMHLARIEFPSGGGRGGGSRAFLRIGEHRIGACPAHIANRCRDWLREWRMEEAEVFCQVRTACTGLAGQLRYSTRLDVALPFRMTTVIPDGGDIPA